MGKSKDQVVTFLREGNELFVRDDYAECIEISNYDYLNTLRVFRSDPETAFIQIRTLSATAKSGKGKKRPMMSNVHIKKSELSSLIKHLQKIQKELK